MVALAEALYLQQHQYCAGFGDDDSVTNGIAERTLTNGRTKPLGDASNPEAEQQLPPGSAAFPHKRMSVQPMATAGAPAGPEDEAHATLPSTKPTAELLSGMLSNGWGGQVLGELCSTANLSEQQAQIVMLVLQQRAKSLGDATPGTAQHEHLMAAQQAAFTTAAGKAATSFAPPLQDTLLSPWRQEQQQSMLGSRPSATPTWLQQLQGPATDINGATSYWSTAAEGSAAAMAPTTAPEQQASAGMDSSQLYASIAAMFDPAGSASTPASAAPVTPATPAGGKPTWASVVGGGEAAHEAGQGEEAGEAKVGGQEIEGDTPKPDFTAQVAVHNVPFKWCHSELEQLFAGHTGFMDAVLLFHDNGRSKGVGVAQFENRAAAMATVAALTGRRVDGRQLELTLLSEDNHISFDTRQVCVLGLPWEYSARDVRALLEGAGHVERVQVLYRTDGKSEGRALACFKTREGARRAVLRLNNRETLAGLHLKLFFVQEPARPRRQPGSFSPAGSPTASPTTALISPQGSFSGQETPGAALGAAGEPGLGSEAGASGQVVPGSVVTSPSGSPASDDKGPTILHVSGLPEGVTREELRALFSTAGEVTKVDIPNGGRNLGYGFITFSSSAAAEQAMLQLNNYPLAGGAVHVAYSTSATARVRQQALQQARARAATMAASPQQSPQGRPLITSAGLPFLTTASLPVNLLSPPPMVACRSLDSSGAMASSIGLLGPRTPAQPSRSLDATAGAAAASYAAQLAAGGLAGFGASAPGADALGAAASGVLPGGDPNLLHASRQLYVSGLPPDLPEEQLHALFAAAGAVEYARKPRNRGYGFVRFAAFESAALAVRSFNGAILPTGERLRVEYSTSFLQRHRHGQTPHLPSGAIDTSGLEGSAAAATAALQQLALQQQQQQQQGWQGGGAVPPPTPPVAGDDSCVPGWMMGGQPPTSVQRMDMDAARGMLPGGMAPAGMSAPSGMATMPNEADMSFLASLTAPGGSAGGRFGGAGGPMAGGPPMQTPGGSLSFSMDAPGMGANLSGGLGLGGAAGLYGAGAGGIGSGLLAPDTFATQGGLQGAWGLDNAGVTGTYGSLLGAGGLTSAGLSMLGTPGMGYGAVGGGASPWHVPQPPPPQLHQQHEGQRQQGPAQAQVQGGGGAAVSAAAPAMSRAGTAHTTDGSSTADMSSQLPESLLPDIM